MGFIDKQIAAMPAEIDKIKADIAKASDAAAKARLESSLVQAESYLAQLKGLKPTLPTRTVSATTKLMEGGREIQLHVVGRAHTDGDLFIYLPKEKVLATGDAVVGWMPFLNDGYPEDWGPTVGELEKLDITQVIVGHGEPVPKSHLTFFRGYLTDLVAAREERRRRRRHPRRDEAQGRRPARSRSTRRACRSTRSVSTASGSPSTSRWSTTRSSRRRERGRWGPRGPHLGRVYFTRSFSSGTTHSG